VSRLAWLGKSGISASTVGAGLIVGSRIGVPALVMGAVGEWLVPRLRADGVLGPHDPFRKIGFLVALAMIMGAAVVDLTIIGSEAVRRLRTARVGDAPPPAARSGGLSGARLGAWVVGWGAALVLVATLLLGQPVGYVLFALALALVFVFINGISTGISDSNPISSAFVVAVLLMSALGLRAPVVAMMAASILLVACTVGVDMQQDRSTGWRLGSNRALQFRYQAIGIVGGAVLCVALAQLFMSAYPVLRVDTFAHPEARVGVWQSAMTFKFVGAIRGLGHLAHHQITALWIGFGIGLGTEVGRKLLARFGAYRTFIASGTLGFAIGWSVDALLLSSPYASSFGGFVDLPTAAWFAAGSLLTSLLSPRRRPAAAPEGAGDALPEDMSAASLIGGGLIAGESLYTLGAGIAALLTML
jgi:hypothetical protein